MMCKTQAKGNRQRVGQTEEYSVYQEGNRTGWLGTGKVETRKSVQETVLKSGMSMSSG